MAKKKNALRKHYIAPFTPATPTTKPAANAYKWLAAGIKTADVENDENTEDIAFYDGDGTEETVIIGVKRGFSFEGDYIPDNEAQALIAGLDLKYGDERKVWFKVVYTNNKQREGVATVKDIELTGGDAAEYEKFKCTIQWNQIPTESAVTGA